MTAIFDYISRAVADPFLRALTYAAITLLIAGAIRIILFPLLSKIANRSSTGIDDDLLGAIQGPAIVTVLFLGVALIIESFSPPPKLLFVLSGLLRTLIILIWGAALLKIGAIFLAAMSRNREKMQWVQPRTLPMLQIAWKIIIVGGIAYFLMLAWHINPTSWLASAGVMGIAIGFAAKDTLANLFAGLFIIADAPFKIGDFVELGDGLRGEIRDIGMRSSRLVTRDDIEVTLPNAVIANAQIVNQTGGPHMKMRVRVKVDVAYGSDADQVREVLMQCVTDVPHLVSHPEPRVRFREFGGSGLRFELLAWIQEPVYRGRVLDILNDRVYKAFDAAGIEIPYAKQDVYVKSWPSKPETVEE